MTDNQELKHYLTIVTQFDSEVELTQWYQDNIAKHIECGKPAFIWSLDDLSLCRNKLTITQQALEKAVEALRKINNELNKGIIRLQFVKDITKEALARIRD